jgi:hypothetical protein
LIFHTYENEKDVSRFEEELLVDENEVRDNKICGGM